MTELLTTVLLIGLPGWAKPGARMSVGPEDQIVWFPDMFHNLTSAQISPKGDMWIIADNMLYKFDEKMGLSMKPMPIRVPRNMAYNPKSDRLCIYYLIGIKILDTQGKVLVDKGVEELRDMGINSVMGGPVSYGKGFLLVGYNEKTGNIMNVLDENGEFVSSFGELIQDPDVHRLPLDLLVPVGLASYGKWLTCIDPYSCDLLIYENESLKQRLHLPVPVSKIGELAPKIGFHVLPDGGTRTSLTIQAQFRTAIVGDVALVYISPVEHVISWLWAIDLKHGRVINSMTIGTDDRYLRLMGFDSGDNPLFWNREGIYRARVVSK